MSRVVFSYDDRLCRSVSDVNVTVNVISLRTVHQQALSACFKGGRAFQVELEFRNVGFEEGGKLENPAGRRTNNKLNSHMMSSPGIKPGPHWWDHCVIPVLLTSL